MELGDSKETENVRKKKKKKKMEKIHDIITIRITIITKT